MASKSHLFVLLLAIFVLILPSCTIGHHAAHEPTLEFETSTFNRASFPKHFIFGTASSAYQVEGAVDEGGRGQTNWDAFTHNHPEKIRNKSNADVAVDQYHRYKEDIGIMKDMNVDAYRFSIAWSRLLPKGKPSGGINKEGIEYYNKLIDALVAKDILPFATIFHWDIPQALEDEYGGFLSLDVVEDFRNYAELCFKEFGDRVKHWITLNEPLTFSHVGYAAGDFAPGRCSEWQKRNCTAGDSATEPYLVTHHQLLAHAAAVELYRTKFQASQKGVIGITLNHNWVIPYSDTKADQDAAERCLDSGFGWYMNPLTYGDYPESQKTIVGKRLPKFTSEESKKLKGSIDFLGLNYYTSNYARDARELNKKHPSYLTDSLAEKPFERDGNPIGPRSASSWLYIYPRGIRDLLLFTKEKYNNPIIYITENGMDEEDDATLSLEEALMDTYRIDYYYRHLYYIKKAIEEGVKVQGFFAWSTLDNFEWNNGYSKRFGLIYVDYRDDLKRHPKYSARWFKNFLKPQQQRTKIATENF